MKTAKKGFTIVELAIVLVVIGIILGMAVKGKALVDAARMKAAVAKINKFEAAVAILYASNGLQRPPVIPGIAAPGLARSIFIERGLLTNADFELGFDNLDWGLFSCYADPNGTDHYFSSDVAAASTYGGAISFCIVAVEDSSITDATWVRMDTPRKYICNVEIAKDDENTTTGHGRGWGALLPETEISKANYRNCDNWTSGDKARYSFMVM
jgi:prepilin-type N-terminal cleavage/methylation domain-containing protein